MVSWHSATQQGWDLVEFVPPGYAQAVAKLRRAGYVWFSYVIRLRGIENCWNRYPKALVELFSALEICTQSISKFSGIETCKRTWFGISAVGRFTKPKFNRRIYHEYIVWWVRLVSYLSPQNLDGLFLIIWTQRKPRSDWSPRMSSFYHGYWFPNKGHLLPDAQISGINLSRFQHLWLEEFQHCQPSLKRSTNFKPTFRYISKSWDIP